MSTKERTRRALAPLLVATALLLGACSRPQQPSSRVPVVGVANYGAHPILDVIR